MLCCTKQAPPHGWTIHNKYLRLKAQCCWLINQVLTSVTDKGRFKNNGRTFGKAGEGKQQRVSHELGNELAGSWMSLPFWQEVMRAGHTYLSQTLQEEIMYSIIRNKG